MFSRLFIRNPVFTTVIALITLLLGGITLYHLPVELYPDITPPTVVVSAFYPGADAKTIADTVGSPIEQSVNGIQDMLYMSSKSADNGSYTLTVTFALGTDIDVATVLLQNLVNNALPTLPAAVQQQGVTVTKSSSSILQFVCLQSPDNAYDNLYLSNYASLQLVNVLARVPGVGQVTIMGASNYAMRVWLDLDRMNALGVSIDEVNGAVAKQNVQVAAGRIGGQPSSDRQQFQFTVLTQGLLDTPEAFGNIIVRTGGPGAGNVPRGNAAGYADGVDGRIVRIRDIARVELGAESYDLIARAHDADAAMIAIYQQPGANALDTARAVNQAMTSLARDFPPGMTWNVPFDTTTFVSTAVHQVYGTFFKATLLVMLVVFVFLQNVRAVIGPAIVIPVTLMGAFLFMGLMGFSVNIITLFALVLAIGLVVDDAIIVVEGTIRHLEKGLSPQDAAIRGMEDLFLSLVAVTLVFASVFLPASFLGGITGQIYRQFALVIGCTAILSALFAVTLNPTECAIWLKPAGPRDGGKNLVFRVFNRGYDALKRGVMAVVSLTLRAPALAVATYLLISGLAVWGYTALPKGFMPNEDQGYVMVSAQLPDAAALPRTQAYMAQLEKAIASVPGIRDWVVVGGTSLLTGNTIPNAVTAFVIFEDWSRRPGISEADIIGGLNRAFAALPEGRTLVVPPPPIMGIGNAGGFDMMVEDRKNLGADALEEAVRLMEQAAAQRPELSGVLSLYSADTPQLYVALDRTRAMSHGLDLSSVFTALQTALGGSYINNFSKFNQNYEVRVQAEERFRSSPESIAALRVVNGNGEGVPLGTVAEVRPIVGPSLVTRYNLYSSASLQGSPAPGTSTGTAMAIMEGLARRVLPDGFGYEWTTMAFQEQSASDQTGVLVGLAVVLVYLILAALYADWILPLSVLLVIPLAVSGTVGAIALRGMDVNVYVQIGLLLLIAMSSKNALILVQFARRYHEEGQSLRDAALSAARVRFRPILMSSLAFAVGAVPLLWATGAGAASQRYLGTAIFGGMVATALLTVLYAPFFFTVFTGLSERLRRNSDSESVSGRRD
mgnify:CR=1 FL=1